LTSSSGSPRLGATNPPTPATIVNAAVAELTASLNAAAVSQAQSQAVVPAAGTVAHLIHDSKSAIVQAELHSRGRASQKLRAQVAPLTEEQLAPLFIDHGDFEAALKKVQPSSKREGFATIPDVSWNDIGALDELREELSMTILQPILNPQQFEAIGLTVPAGVLLFGPPGCGQCPAGANMLRTRTTTIDSFLTVVCLFRRSLVLSVARLSFPLPQVKPSLRKLSRTRVVRASYRSRVPSC
jgi:hypothetical protein